jgi:hypothetical protein
MTDDAPKKTADELLQDCANNTAAMLALHRARPICDIAPGGAPDDVEVVACCARELEWLALGVELRRMEQRHASPPEPVNPATWAADALGVLTLIRTQRFYVATTETPAGTRNVYPVATEKPVRVPYELRFRNIDNAWAHRAPPMSARSSAPNRGAHRSRSRR